MTGVREATKTSIAYRLLLIPLSVIRKYNPLGTPAVSHVNTFVDWPLTPVEYIEEALAATSVVNATSPIM